MSVANSCFVTSAAALSIFRGQSISLLFMGHCARAAPISRQNSPLSRIDAARSKRANLRFPSACRRRSLTAFFNNYCALRSAALWTVFVCSTCVLCVCVCVRERKSTTVCAARWNPDLPSRERDWSPECVASAPPDNHPRATKFVMQNIFGRHFTRKITRVRGDPARTPGSMLCSSKTCCKFTPHSVYSKRLAHTAKIDFVLVDWPQIHIFAFLKRFISNSPKLKVNLDKEEAFIFFTPCSNNSEVYMV